MNEENSLDDVLAQKAENLVMEILQKAEENNTIINSEEEKATVNFEIKNPENDIVIGTKIQEECQSIVSEIKYLEEDSQIQIDSEIGIQESDQSAISEIKCSEEVLQINSEKKVQESDQPTVSEIKASEEVLQIDSEIKIQENSSIDPLKEAPKVCEMCGVPKQ